MILGEQQKEKDSLLFFTSPNPKQQQRKQNLLPKVVPYTWDEFPVCNSQLPNFSRAPGNGQPEPGQPGGAHHLEAKLRKELLKVSKRGVKKQANKS